MTWDFKQEGSQRGLTNTFEALKDVDDSAFIMGTDNYLGTHLYFRDYFFASNGIGLAAGGAATATVDYSGLSLVSGADYISVYRYLVGLITPLGWLASKKFKISLLSAPTSGYWYIRTGYYNTATSWTTGVGTPTPTTERHFGFWVVNGAVYGSTGDGTNYSTVDLSYNVGTVVLPSYKFEAIYTLGVGVEFFISSVSKGTLTTTLPTHNSSDLSRYYIISAGAKNAGAALNLREFVFLQAT